MRMAFCISGLFGGHLKLIEEECKHVGLLCDFLAEAGAHPVTGGGAEADEIVEDGEGWTFRLVISVEKENVFSVEKENTWVG